MTYFFPLTPAQRLRPLQRIKKLKTETRNREAATVKRPDPEVLRIAALDMTIIAEDELIQEIETIARFARDAAESDAGIDDLDQLDRWNFDKLCSPALVYRLCALIKREEHQ